MLFALFLLDCDRKAVLTRPNVCFQLTLLTPFPQSQCHSERQQIFAETHRERQTRTEAATSCHKFSRSLILSNRHLHRNMFAQSRSISATIFKLLLSAFCLIFHSQKASQNIAWRYKLLARLLSRHLFICSTRLRVSRSKNEKFIK